MSDIGKWAVTQEQQKQHGEAQAIESAVETADFSTTESGNWHNWLREEIVKALRERDNEIKRLRDLLADTPCTCMNPPPYDWPHDPNNQECYLNRVREALGHE